MEAQGRDACRLARGDEAAGEGGSVEAAADLVGEDVVVGAEEVRTVAEAVERGQGLVTERDVPDASALRGAFDAVGDGALYHQHSLAPANVAPRSGTISPRRRPV